MKSRNREISIFSLSLMDVISGAMGAFLIVMVIQARFTAVNEGNDPEKLRPRLDAAMEALANARAGTEKSIAQNYVNTIKPKTQGLSGGETVPEITALGRALRADIDTINTGFAETLEERGAATRALANASAGTEKTFKDRMSRDKPATLGLKRGNTVSEITALGQALRNDIGHIDQGLERTINQRNAATSTLWIASAGTEKIFKDRIGAKPATQGLARGVTLPEIEKLGGALKADIDTIYREFRKGKESSSDALFAVNTVFSCTYYLQIASDETDPSTGKPWPPYTPVPRDGTIFVNGSLEGLHGQSSVLYPAITYLNPRAVLGRQYKIYLINVSNGCEGRVMTLGWSAAMDARIRNAPKSSSGSEIKKELEFSRTWRSISVNVSWPRDSVVASDGKRYGVYYLGAITVDKDRNISFSRAGPEERDAEIMAIQARMDGSRRPEEKKEPRHPEEKKADNPPLNREAVLARIDKLPVPRDVPSCARTIVGELRMLEKLKLADARSSTTLHGAMDDCRSNRFPDALSKLKSEMHRVLAEKKEEKPPLAREATLAEIDKLPVPRNSRDCMLMVGRALRTLSELKLTPDQMKIPPAEGRAAIDEVRSDCAGDRFQDAQKKLQAVIHRLIE